MRSCSLQLLYFVELPIKNVISGALLKSLTLVVYERSALGQIQSVQSGSDSSVIE